MRLRRVDHTVLLHFFCFLDFWSRQAAKDWNGTGTTDSNDRFLLCFVHSCSIALPVIVSGLPVLGFTLGPFLLTAWLVSLMDVCEHCKRWTSERDKACRLCRLCVALTQVSGQPGFTEEDYERTAEQLASILGNLTSKVLLAPVGGRSSFIAPRDTNTRGELPGSGEELRSQGSTGEHTSRRRHSDRSRDRRRQRRPPTRSPNQKVSLLSRIDVKGGDTIPPHLARYLVTGRGSELAQNKRNQHPLLVKA